MSNLFSKLFPSNPKPEPPRVVRGPLIQVAQSQLWTRDPVVTELIEFFDQPEIRGDWDKLDSGMLAEIEKQIEACRGSFEYAARNYFALRHKDGYRIPFNLWPVQELILEELYWLKSRGKAQKLMIIKARQLGASTLIEALMAWRTMFFSGQRGLLISYDEAHAAYLFQNGPQFIYDNLPWWLKPMVSSRKIEEGIIFNNPRHEDRPLRPGVDSQIIVQAATGQVGVGGQGTRVNILHASEFSDWEPDKAREIIEGDMNYSLPRSPETIAVLESTGKNAGRYAHKLWNKMVELGEQADWWPRFYPWFFETTRVLAPDKGWKIQATEAGVQERVKREWVRCDNPKCGRYNYAHFGGEHTAGTRCGWCQAGVFQPLLLTDEQLFCHEYLRINAEKDEDSLKKFLQEMPSTPEDAFQMPGISVFTAQEQLCANESVADPIARGNFDSHGRFHGYNPDTRQCWEPRCDKDHRYDEAPVSIWEFPVDGATYAAGTDVAEGLGGEYDHSVCSVVKVGGMGRKDELVARFRSNTIGPVQLAYPVNFLGRMYNNALLAVEVNKYDACEETLRSHLGYPNLYQDKNSSKAVGRRVAKWGWHTTPITKRRLVAWMKLWLAARSILIRSANCASEMKTFTTNDVNASANAKRGYHDDELIATMIAGYVAHHQDFDENLGYIPLPVSREEQVRYATWKVVCRRCGDERGSENPERSGRCPQCGSVLITAARNVPQVDPFNFDYYFKEAEADAQRFEEMYTRPDTGDDPW